MAFSDPIASRNLDELPQEKPVFSIRQLFCKQFKVTIASSVRRTHIDARQVGVHANGRAARRGAKLVPSTSSNSTG
jgi:hypothetical protein